MPSPPFPIVFSPPPLEGGNSGQQQLQQQQQQQQQQQAPNLLSSRTQERHQSVGYNLQHEFETLNADLDLDLNQSETLMGFNYPVVAPRPVLSFLLEPVSAGSTLNLNTFHSTSSTGTSAPGTTTGTGTGANATAPAAANFLPRPHLVQDFAWPSVTPFYHDLMTFSLWIETLSPQDTVTMVNHLCNLLPAETLQLFRLKLSALLRQMPPSLAPGGSTQGLSLSSQLQQQLLNSQHLQRHPQSSHIDDIFDNLSLQPRYDQLQQPKPKHRFDKFDKLRPRLADPHTRLLDRRLPTSHLYEKTLFLQAAALQQQGQVQPHQHHHQHQHQHQLQQGQGQLLSQVPQIQTPGSVNSNQPSVSGGVGGSGGSGATATTNAASSATTDDLSAQLKLGALATISLRVALDLRKGFRYEQQMARTANLSSVPPKGSNGLRLVSGTHSSPSTASGVPQWPIISGNGNSMNHSSGGNTSSTSSNSSNSNSNNNMTNNSNTSATNMTSSNSSFELTPTSLMPPDIANIELLKNIPAWLKLLRLHKYTDCLKDIPWRELIELDDTVLEEKGVKALGARRKLLKAFDVVKQNTN